MKISIISPMHAAYNKFVSDAFNSLVSQSNPDWEWIIGTNNGGEVSEHIADDPRVKVREITGTEIGTLKRNCARYATGEILVELDIDDMLTPDALDCIAEAFSEKEIVFAYSNSAEFKNDTFEPHTYSEAYGWKSRPVQLAVNGVQRDLIETIAFEPSPHMMRYIFWAPNHVRAWRTSTYFAVGGHSDMEVGDDHEIVARLYALYGDTGFKHIDMCLYLYRIHDENTCVVKNEKVQQATYQVYHKYFRPMVEIWARNKGLKLLDIGGGIDPKFGYTSVDKTNADIILDLNEDWNEIEDNSIGIAIADNIFEHLTDSIHTMNELYRILAPGGVAFIVVPSTDGRGAFQDPTHKSFWNINSFAYYTDSNYARYIPEYKGRFQISRIFDTEKDENNVILTVAELIAIKDGFVSPGEVKI
ncbi:MAG: glycosyltransferase [Deltaproteobacteria bacterium]|nr:glycosyltransferase [Deltaproteobacteria bacterium]